MGPEIEARFAREQRDLMVMVVHERTQRRPVPPTNADVDEKAEAAATLA